MDIFKTNDFLTTALGLRELEFEICFLFFGSLNALNLFELLQFTLGLGCLGCLGSKSFDKFC